MGDPQASGSHQPQCLDEFIKRYAPSFAAHPGELVMVVERDDDNSFRGGPEMEVPSTGGMIMNASYRLAVIDSDSALRMSGQFAVLPVVASTRVHGQGMNVLEDPNGFIFISLIELGKMGETLMSQDARYPMQPFPAFEIFVGDAEVAKAMDIVQHDREVVAIGEAAKKLGCPIVQSKTLDDAREARITAQIDILIRFFRSRGSDGPSWSVEECLRVLESCGVTGDEVVTRAVERITLQFRGFLIGQGV